MKIAFIVPVLDEINIDRTFKRISNSCDTNFDVYFAINGKLNNLFTQIRSTFANESKVKAFMVDRPVNEHKLITLGMAMTGDYDATIIYSGKEEPNNDVIKAFISSWKAGNKIVYLKKEYSGIKKLWVNLKRGLYKMFIKFLGIFKDICAETDIQLLDQDVVKTINQLPQKNRQLRVLDSFVGYPTDVIQLEIDYKMYENKRYDEKTRSYKGYGIASALTILGAIGAISLCFVGFSLKWTMPIIVYISLFILGLFGLILSTILLTKRTLTFRVGTIFDQNELNDLKNKLEKYNISNDINNKKGK